jgi:pimeloyl-ACP methyl ester carboxylesterase
MADMELEHALARLTIPTLVMAGDQDRLTPVSAARKFASQLPQLARLIELPNQGHMGPLELPDEVSEALRQLAASVAGSGTSAGVPTAA